MNTKYIFISGGVASSLGKGIIASSLAKLLQARGLRVTIQKFDPYINIDPGTLNPYEYGELSEEALFNASGQPDLCTACFSGRYPTDLYGREED